MILKNQTEMEHAIGSVNKSLANYLESASGLWNSYVDPREAYLVDGEIWNDIGQGSAPTDELPFQTTTQLFHIQSVTRILSRSNEFAINGHTNRINYIVGKSHVYTVVGRDASTADASIEKVQDVLDKILKVNKWKKRQKETKLRDDRDGESYTRKFRPNDGIMRFRFIEPRDNIPPENAQPFESFGIRTKPNDLESVEAYYIASEKKWVDASEIQHRKFNVDSSIKRGYPLMFPVRKNLIRASKLLRNMSVATEIQTAIAMIRKHAQAGKEAVKSFINLKATQEKNLRGGTDNVLKYDSGSIVDAPRGTDYDIPKQLDPSKTVNALQAELRAISSRLVMPEFMLSSDASNANYASTMVAEGPSVKNFEAEQDTQKEYDLELIEEALQFAVDSGLLASTDLRAVRIEVQGPDVQVRNRVEEASVRQINMGLGILSKQTATGEAGYDYSQEQTNIEQNQEADGGLPFGKLVPDKPLIESKVEGKTEKSVELELMKEYFSQTQKTVEMLKPQTLPPAPETVVETQVVAVENPKTEMEIAIESAAKRYNLTFEEVEQLKGEFLESE